MARTRKIIQEVETAVESAWVEILSPVQHSGEKLLIGAVREIEASAAAALVKLGAARIVEAPPAD
jgi:ATP-dependent helicase YprA (DUF1998 family)